MAGITVSGKIKDYFLKKTIKGLDVELWKNLGSHSELITVKQTNRYGNFSISGIDNTELTDGFLKVSFNGVYLSIEEGSNYVSFEDDSVNDLFVNFRDEEEIPEEISLIGKVVHNTKSDLNELNIQILLDLGEGEDKPELFYGSVRNNGLIAIPWKVYSNSPHNSSSLNLNVDVNIFDFKNNLLDTQTNSLDLESKYALTINLDNLNLLRDTSPKLNELQISIPINLQTILDNKNIDSLEGVRLVGGLNKLDEIDESIDANIVSQIDAHANLNLISSEIADNTILIDNGYSTVRSIFKESHSKFIETNRNDLGDFKSASLYKKASIFDRSVQKLITEDKLGILKKADGAEPFRRIDEPLLAHQNLVLFPDGLDNSCQCKDCASGVSPLAYLADLMSFTLKNLKDNDENVTLNELSNTFCQPFHTLPLSCEMIHKQFCQIRLATEILKCNYTKIESSRTACQISALERSIQSYIETAYLELLDNIGTSFQDLRAIQNASEEEKVKLSNKLGIPYSYDFEGTTIYTLDELFIDFKTTSSVLTEDKIEELFGLRDTNRTLLEDTPDSKILDWRKLFLKDRWFTQDHQMNKIEEIQNNEYFLIDPDLINLNDFNPLNAAIEIDIWKARRHFLDNALLKISESVATATESKMEVIIQLLNGPNSPIELIEYLKPGAGSPTSIGDFIWGELTFDGTTSYIDGTLIELLRSQLLNGDFTNLDAIQDILLFTKSNFLRFSELFIKDQEYNNNPTNEALSSEEWIELYSLLLSCIKKKARSVWFEEEDINNENIALSISNFWISTTEPSEGNWLVNPRNLLDFSDSKRIPIIEPELVEVSLLKEDDTYIGIYESRKLELETINDDLRTSYDNHNPSATISAFEEIMNLAISPSFSGGYSNYQDVLNGLNSTVVLDVEAAELFTVSEFKMPVTSFQRLMDLKVIDEDGNFELSEEEKEEAFSILTSTQKVREKYPQWNTFEEGISNSLTDKNNYWQILKPKLVKHLASQEDRQYWQNLLEILNKTPIIDPDYLNPSQFVEPISGSVFTIWSNRKNTIKTEFDSMDTTNYGVLLSQYIHIDLVDLKDLQLSNESGVNIKKRLSQLNLGYDTLAYLLNIDKIITDGGTVLNSEWDEVKNILISIWKKEQFFQWNKEERDEKISLSQYFFKLKENAFNDIEGTIKWRTNFLERVRWQRKLKARIAQEDNVVEALTKAIEDTEENTLKILRDAYIEASGAEGEPFNNKAKRLTDYLIVDMQNNCCSKTTRIALAIEIFQGLLWSVRTKQLQDTYPNFTISSTSFDEEWKWIGSYSTWRSAMFVYLFPENILLPTLRKRQSPKFRQLVNDIRKNQRFTPNMACQAAENYSQYYFDISNLRVDATCEAETVIEQINCGNKKPQTAICQLYMFGQRPGSDIVYWSTTNPLEEDGYQQSFWEQVDGLSGVVKILGSVVYETPDDGKQVYLFVKTNIKGVDELKYIRFSIKKQQWETEPITLKLFKNDDLTSFQALVKKSTDYRSAPHIIIKVEPFKYVLDRKLNQDGTDWEDTDWNYLANSYADYGELIEFLEVDQNNSVLIYNKIEQLYGRSYYRILGKDDDYSSQLAIQYYAGSIMSKINSVNENNIFIYSKYYDNHSFEFNSGITYNYYNLTGNTNFFSHTTKSIYQFNQKVKEITGLDFLDYIWKPSPDYDLNLKTLLSASFGFGFTIGKEWVKYHKNVLLNDGGNATELWQKEWEIADKMIKKITYDNLGIFDSFLKLFSNDILIVKTRIDDKSIFTHNLKIGSNSNNDLKFIVTKSSDKYGIDLINSKTPYILQRLSSSSKGNWKYFANSFSSNNFIFADNTTSNQFVNNVNDLTPSRVNPIVQSPLNITENFTSDELKIRKLKIEQAFVTNSADQKMNSLYLDEAYYFLPMHLAGELEHRAHFKESLDWYRTVYNYADEYDKRKIYYGLKREESLAEIFDRGDNWLLDPLNPHSIASNRPLTYTRYTIMAIVRCFLAYADAEFTSDTAESVPRAKTLYLTALELLELNEMQSRSTACEDLKIPILEAIQCNIADEDGFSDWHEFIEETIASQSLVGASQSQMITIADNINTIITSGSGVENIATSIYTEVNQANVEAPALTFNEIQSEQEAQLVEAESVIYSSPEMVNVAQAAAEHQFREFAWNMQLITGFSSSELINAETELPWLQESSDHINETPMEQGPLFAEQKKFDLMSPSAQAIRANAAQMHPWSAMQDASLYEGAYVPILYYGFCVPDNPVMGYYRMQAEMNLFKIRNCMNIAGVKRELDPYAAPTDTTSGLPYIGVGGNLVLAGSIDFPATPYHYQVIISRAKELIQIAQQVESQFLSLLEKRDAEYYNVMKARQDLRLSKAGVRLQDLRLKTSEQELDLAELQMERSELQVQGLEEMINAGLNEHELKMIEMYYTVAAMQTLSIIGNSIYKLASTSGGSMFTEIVNKALAGVGIGISAGADITNAFLNAGIQNQSILSSYARRKQEWGFQKTLASHDVKIGAQGVKIAESRLRVVGQEKAISELQEEFAQDTVEFLANKFTNVELYDWMSGVMEGVYSYFLRQATSMAKLGERQLAFERQQLPPAYIKDDYWEVPIDNSVVGTIGGNDTDKRGLTGSALLLQDLYQLDQYSFDTDKRKLNLSKSFSLSQLMPIEFQEFKENGVITFDTLKQYFDDDFPGHYLRLIKKVKVSVIALIPPLNGIKASLTSSGLSQTTIKGQTYQDITIRRTPETIAFTSPNEATGIFELMPEQDKLNPFEANGVHTRWQLKLPKATNRFNFDTIADVIFTIEYTAFHDVNLERQTVQTWDPFVGIDRSFSFKQEFADQWFDLNHSDQIDTPMSVSFKTGAYDYPPNIDALALDQLMLLFITDNDTSLNLGPTGIDVTLKLHDAAGNLISQGVANLDNSGFISTLSGGASGFTNIANGTNIPVGTWTMELPDIPEVRALFENEIIKDILFITTVSGLKPEYPID